MKTPLFAVIALVASASVVTLTLQPLDANAQDKFPSKTITIVVPYPPGGSNDNFARAVGKRLSDAVQQSVVIDNRPGAGGSIGTALVAKGYVQASDIEPVIGALLTIGSVIWSVADKRNR